LQPLAKIPVANRGEIAVRALFAANETCRSTVAVFAEEDRPSLHRFEADGSCRIGAGRGRQALARNRSLACFGANSDTLRGGFPEALSCKILRGGAPIDGRPGRHPEPADFDARCQEAEARVGHPVSEGELPSCILYP